MSVYHHCKHSLPAIYAVSIASDCPTCLQAACELCVSSRYVMKKGPSWLHDISGMHWARLRRLLCCRSSTLPEQYIPEISEALTKAGLKWSDFKVTDNTCGPHPPQESLAQEVRACCIFASALQLSQAQLLQCSGNCLARFWRLDMKVAQSSAKQCPQAGKGNCSLQLYAPRMRDVVLARLLLEALVVLANGLSCDRVI